jgi:hypothetical protein
VVVRVPLRCSLFPKAENVESMADATSWREVENLRLARVAVTAITVVMGITVKVGPGEISSE